MKVRNRGTFEATKMPKCADDGISEKWLVIANDGTPSYYADSQFNETFEPVRKTRGRAEANS